MREKLVSVFVPMIDLQLEIQLERDVGAILNN
jgi:hypothetical protein